MKDSKVCKIYLDTSILSRFMDQRLVISEADARALKLLGENQEVYFVVSLKVKQELEKVPNPIRNDLLQFIYFAYQEIPHRICEVASRGCYGSARYGSTRYGRSGGWVHPTFQGLRGIFEPDDAEHIFFASEDECDYFLTLDKHTILSRVRANPQEIRSLCGKMRFGSPEEVLALIEGSCP